MKPETIGIPIFDTDAKVVHPETLRDLEPDQVEELLIKGPEVMKDYLNRPEETKKAFHEGWLRTGDLAVMDQEGFFRIVDRRKEVIIYKG